MTKPDKKTVGVKTECPFCEGPVRMDDGDGVVFEASDGECDECGAEWEVTEVRVLASWWKAPQEKASS